MTLRTIEKHLAELKALQAQQKDLEKQIEALQEKIKAELRARDTNEIETPAFIVRWTPTVRNTFDTKGFQAAHPRLYSKFVKESASKRFSVVAQG